MGTLDFLAEFKALHDKAKSGKLQPGERQRYEMARTQFERVVLMAQQLGQTGKTLRSTLRMTKMLKVELRPDDGPPLKMSTIDLATGGFAGLLPNGMRVGTSVEFTLYLPAVGGGSSPLRGRVSVASSRSQAALFRVSFRFEELDPTAKDQLAFALTDAVLERINEMP